eukprot:1170066-Pyramimonas_sp.AAC.1
MPRCPYQKPLLALCAAWCLTVLWCASLRVAVALHLKYTCATLELHVSNACNALEPRVEHA